MKKELVRRIYLAKKATNNGEMKRITTMRGIKVASQKKQEATSEVLLTCVNLLLSKLRHLKS
jgi:hypothetical protein